MMKPDLRRFLIPWLIGFVLLQFAPLIGCILLSFTDTKKAVDSSIRWVGLEHYRTALAWDAKDSVGDGQMPRHVVLAPREPRLFQALWNSVVYTAWVVPLSSIVSLGLALLLHQPVRFGGLFRTVVYLPHLLGGVATMLIWSWMLNPEFGWVNHLIRGMESVFQLVARLFGAATGSAWNMPQWLHSPAGCKPALVLIQLWSVGGATLIMLAALRGIPGVSYDVARMDGAGTWAKFRYVTFPRLTPVLLLNGVLSLLFSMQSFSAPYLLQNREQRDGLLFFMVYLYQTAFEPPYRMGYACALSVLFVGVVTFMVFLLFRLTRRWVFYAGDDPAVF